MDRVMLQSRYARSDAMDIPQGRISEWSVAVILPCYKAKAHVLDVIARIPRTVQTVLCVDDACPESTGKHIAEHTDDPRVRVIYHNENKGVGGAVMTGYTAALAAGADICVKIDSDGQMDPAMIPYLISPIVAGNADYTKGNRFAVIEDVRGMPLGRIVGNVGLSFMTKLSSGYWNIFDPTNGFTAIHARVLERLPLRKISERYFFESDVLFRLGTLRACVADVPMPAIYGSEVSNLKVGAVALPFLVKNLRNTWKRVFYNYLLRDFSVGSLYLLLSITLISVGGAAGGAFWINGLQIGRAATAGQVMFSALPLIIGLQLFLSFMNYDIERTPKTAIYPLLPELPGLTKRDVKAEAI
jgi:dolichol-phosphate mannosyltransferase